MTGKPGSGRNSTGSFRSDRRGNAGQSVLAVDVHRIRSTDSFAARPAQGQRVVDGLDADQRVEQHAIRGLHFDVIVLHARLGILVWIVAVNPEFHAVS
jgi:hypothetical protein